MWSCGVNDDAALGRITKDVPDPDNPEAFLSIDDLTAIPHPLESLVSEGFRAVRIAAGDSISAAISDQGELRVWGSFRVRTHFQLFIHCLSYALLAGCGRLPGLLRRRPTRVPSEGNVRLAHQGRRR